jgi:hypothetical protein
VGDLALLARLELFEACRSLALLASGGFIERKEFVAPKVLQRQGEDFVERARTALAFYGFTMLLVMVLGGILLGIFLGLRATPEAATDGAPEGVIAASSVDPMRNALTVAQMERIRTAIELYKVRRGDYPARIERLLDLGILSQDDLHYPDYIGTYKYKPTGNTYRLSRPKR